MLRRAATEAAKPRRGLAGRRRSIPTAIRRCFPTPGPSRVGSAVSGDEVLIQEEEVDETIDLGKYLLALIRRWRLIALVTLLFAGAAIVVAAIQKPTYSAVAQVASVRIITQISFGTAIQTTDEIGRPSSTNRTQRLESYVALVRNPTIAAAVLAELGDDLPRSQRTVGALLRMVSAEIRDRTDLIAITATHSDATIPVRLANAWARVYVSQINDMYGGGEERTHGSVRQELATAEEAYAREQADLESFLETDQRGEIQRRILESQAALAALVEARNRVIPDLVDNIERVDQLLADAQDMSVQVREGGSSATESNALALALLKTRAYARSGLEWDVHFQVGGDSPTSEEIGTDLASLVAALSSRRDTLLSELAALADALDAGKTIGPLARTLGREGEINSQVTTASSEVEERIRSLQAQLEREESKYGQLAVRRDLAKETYATLIRKEAELSIAVRTKSEEIRVAAPASLVTRGGIGTLMLVGIPAVLGGMVGVVLALVLDYWQSYKEGLAQSERHERGSVVGGTS